MVRLAQPKQHKYNAQKTGVNGVTFDSKLEACRYRQLLLLEQAGQISSLELQPKFQLQPAFKGIDGKRQRAIMYQADFSYVEYGVTIVEEVKGFQTAVWKLKRKMFLYHYPAKELRVLGKEDI
jgi:hypothetical protein